MSVAAAASEVIVDQDKETDLSSWTWRDRGVSIQLVQRSPDQTRAFFLGRGFGREDADLAGRACVFQTIFRNDGDLPVEYELNDWEVLYREDKLGLKTREVWDRIWLDRGIAEAPRIAFRWSLLPTAQRFEPGDYNWGMTSFGLAPGETFDLSLALVVGGEPAVTRIDGLVCAADR